MKLKFLTLLSQESINYRDILEERLGLKKVRWYHTFYFIRTFRNLVAEIEVLRDLDPKLVEEDEKCKILRPPKIDEIAFGAMVELQVLFQNPGDKDIGVLITECISLSCYESHTKQKFDSDSDHYKQFVVTIGEQNVVHMLGLYNWIDKEINTSVEKWNNLFRQVEVHDQDWDNAGGSMMDKFDVLNSIKKTCLAFNLDYHKAIQMPYGLIKANSLSDATNYFIRDKMRIIIEARMKSERGQS